MFTAIEFKRIHRKFKEVQSKRKQKMITVETLNSLYTFFLNEYKLLNDIEKLDVY